MKAELVCLLVLLTAVVQGKVLKKYQLKQDELLNALLQRRSLVRGPQTEQVLDSFDDVNGGSYDLNGGSSGRANTISDIQQLLYNIAMSLEPLKDSVPCECLNGWVYYEGSCYLFGHTDSSFVEAERFCIQYQAHLVTIDTARENNFIRSFLSNLKETEHWIGLTDDIAEGEWRWQSNDPLARFTDWSPVEPNGDKRENCVVIRAEYNYQWADYPCTHQFSPLCEMPSNGEKEIFG